MIVNFRNLIWEVLSLTDEMTIHLLSVCCVPDRVEEEIDLNYFPAIPLNLVPEIIIEYLT